MRALLSSTPRPHPARASGPLAVSHVVLSLDVGGLERVVLDLVREGVRGGQRVSVVCLERLGRLADEVEAMGATVACLNKRAGLRPATTLGLRSVLRRLRPDVIHTHQLGALFYAALATATPAVHTEHGRASLERPRRRALARLSAWRASRFVCVSQDLGDEYRARGLVSPGKLRVISNGIDMQRFRGGFLRGHAKRDLGLPPGDPVVGTVGRLDEIKRQDLLIRAFASSLESVPRARLLLVGDGPARDELRRLAGDLGVADRVHFVGYLPDPAPCLRAMDLFALTSRSEGMPLAVLEAWAAGLPVVATRVGGLAEMTAGRPAAALVEPGDVGAIRDAITGLLRDADAAKALGEAGRRRVAEAYSLERMAADYHREYLGAIGR